MAAQQRSHFDRTPAAVVVRLVAFIVASLGVIAVPAIIVATSTGLLSHRDALIASAAAVSLVAVSALAVRPFDPLRG